MLIQFPSSECETNRNRHVSIGGKEGRSSFTPIIVVGRIVMQLYAVRASFNFHV